MPDQTPAQHTHTARRHVLAGDTAAAARAVNDALKSGACSAEQLNVLAAVLFHCEQQKQALALYHRASTLDQGNLESVRGLAFAHRALGNIADAEAAADRVLNQEPNDFELLHLRSSLRRQTPDSHHVDQLERALSVGMSNWRGAVQVGFALAKELEDIGRYRDSFACLVRAAKLKRRNTKYDVRQDLSTLEAIRAAFDEKSIASARGSGHLSDEPIFVLGLPRTGSTLVERIISSHPDVQSAGELNAFALELVKLTTAANLGRSVDKALLPLAAARVNMHGLGANYVEATRPLTGKARYFVDKMPMNALYIGLIHLALPNAKIVLVERCAQDVCYAMYKFLFNGAYPFSYDLEEVATYYLAHQELMRHWDSVLPAGAICRVRYEDLVADQEGESRRIMRHLDLTWSDACLDFVGNESAVTTGSATQVRQSIYRSSVGLWRRYQQELAPMLRILKAGGIICDTTSKRAP
jgi:Sulfotransferase family/Tetratricopeptide repeat